MNHGHRHHVALVGLGLGALLLLCGCPRDNNEEIQVTVTDEGGGEARTPPAESELLALARSEGEVAWYTSITEDQAQQFADKFEARYPGVRVELVRGGTFDLAERVQREISAGQPRADVLHVLDPAIFVSLRQRGELYYYGAPEAAAVPMEYKDPGYWTGARLVTLGLAYDRQRLPGDRAPQRWRDLLEDRFRGKIGLKDAQTAGSAYAQYYFLRERYGVDYWQQTARLRPRIYKTEEDLLDAVASGEILVAAGIMTGSAPGADNGPPPSVKMALARDGVPLVLGPVAILSRAPHRNAARLLVNYILSRDGQAALRDLLGAYSTRADLAAPQGSPALTTLPLLRPESGWSEYLDKQGALRSEYTRLFHGESE
ncbi:MAG: extracellular solute-binding protein [Armatimonadetes bacterium]|nr:extracellular solute-binding protein [Armatimonadota bacterium]